VENFALPWTPNRPARTVVLDSVIRCGSATAPAGCQDQESKTLNKTHKTTTAGKTEEPTNKPFALRFPANASQAAKVLAKNVRRLREQRELTQAGLAKKVGTDQAVIGMIELGRSNPTLRMIEAIARALKTTVSSLLTKQVRL
jgi:DNA-binding XRE family transcriptional regulator